MGKQLAGKKALITGGGNGIGMGIAQAFVREGAVVAILGRSRNVRETAAMLGKQAFSYEADITDRDSLGKSIEKMEQEIGPVDILVNNAGISQLCRFLDLSEEILEKHYRTNVLGAVRCAGLVLPHMMRQHYGRIINMSSVTGPFVADPGDSAYAMTKAAMIGLTKSLAVEFAPYNITVNAICPGYILSPMSYGSASRSCPMNPQQILDSIAAGIPLKRLGTAQEIGKLASFLAGDGAAYITGQAMIIDGGNSIQETNAMGFRDA